MSAITIAILTGLGAMFFWGLSGFVEKALIDRTDPFRAMLLAQVFIVPFAALALIYDPTIPRLSVGLFLSALMFAFLDFLGFMLLYRAYERGKVSIVLPIQSSFAALAAVVSFVYFGEDFSLLKVVLIVFIVIGIIILSVDFKELRDGVDMSDVFTSAKYAIGSLLVYGLFVPFWDKFLDGEGWIFKTQLQRTLLLVIIAVNIYLVRRQNIREFVTKKNIMILAILTAVTLGIGNLFFAFGLHSSDQTSISAAVSSTYPLVSIIGAYLFLGERISAFKMIGVGIVITSIAAMSLL